MFTIDNFLVNKNNCTVLAHEGPFRIIQWQNELEINPDKAERRFYAGKMQTHKRQAVCDVSNSDITCHEDDVSWRVGNLSVIESQSSGEMLVKKIAKKQAEHNRTKVEFTGKGYLVLKATYKHIVAFDLALWAGGLVVEDKYILAYQSELHQKIISKNSTSATLVGGEGNAAIQLYGEGVLLLKLNRPLSEYIEVNLQNDVFVCNEELPVLWASTLQHLVEGNTHTFKGQGKILLAPTITD